MSSTSSQQPHPYLPAELTRVRTTHGDRRPRRMQIEDWEIGALFWNCYRQHNGDEEAARQLVRQRYYDDFVANKDLHLFVGTTLAHHVTAPNPFVIIGVF